MLYALLACTPPAPVPDPEDPSTPDPTGRPATQVGSEGTEVIVQLLSPAEDAAPLDSEIVLTSDVPSTSLEPLVLSLGEVSGTTTYWPNLLVFTPDAPLDPETAYEAATNTPDPPLGSLEPTTLWTGTELARPPGTVTLSIEPDIPGYISVQLEIEVEEPAWLRLHHGSCADIGEGLLGAYRVDGSESWALRRADEGECLCAVLMSASGVEGAPSELVCS